MAQHNERVLPMSKHSYEPRGISVRHGAYLPHWTREGSIYAINFRLADSLPKSILKAWEFERLDIIRTAQEMSRPLSLAEEARLDKLYSEKVET
jgi:menaquinone-specific isochorismate synthase